jgi:hypothetical protein
MKRNAEVGLPMKLSFFLRERHLAAMSRLRQSALAATAESWLEATPTGAFITD